ncbi:ATP-dependent Clp protease adapter ClpS [Andreprevotia sp. IGB-42]|uniref:ATP-dependent Clp protease adapter ClpS n=1 Tax=Andreprevotia sp. IGB-42 TaxID=2497473 RepID=UPI0035B5471D
MRNRGEWNSMATEHHIDPQLAEQETRVGPPPLYTVLLMNDDYTPMEFVVVVLQQFFAMAHEQANMVMLKVHTEGRGVCGVYPKDIAATKVDEVNSFARQHHHPLQCIMEVQE